MGRNNLSGSSTSHVCILGAQVCHHCSNPLFLILQNSLVSDTSPDALASTEVTEEAQSLEVEAQFRVPVSGGLLKVQINSRADKV